MLLIQRNNPKEDNFFKSSLELTLVNYFSEIGNTDALRILPSTPVQGQDWETMKNIGHMLILEFLTNV